MTLQTKCLNGSTANNRAVSILALAGIMMLGGCAGARHQLPAAPPVRGYADLDALVRRHPGWAGVALYDQALARLARAANRSAAGAPDDQTLAMLPSISTEPGVAPTPALTVERLRLAEATRLQIARLRERQAQSRARRLALNREVWQRKAQAQFVQAAQSAQADYLRRVQDLTADEQARRLNLTLQIKALQDIVSGWDKSVPPTPRLNQARLDLTSKQAELTALLQAQGEAASQALAARKAAIVKAQKARAASVSQQSDQEKARLEAQDAQQVAALEERLTEERVAVLNQEQSPPNTAAPAAGALEAKTLPAGPIVLMPPVGATVHSLRASEAHLRAQRARWLAFLYDDTRAAVLDVARQRHWSITFQRSPAKAADLTGPLGQALTVSVWKSEGLL